MVAVINIEHDRKEFSCGLEKKGGSKRGGSWTEKYNWQANRLQECMQKKRRWRRDRGEIENKTGQMHIGVAAC